MAGGRIHWAAFCGGWLLLAAPVVAAKTAAVGAAGVQGRLDRLINQYRKIHSITFSATRSLVAGRLPDAAKAPPVKSFKEVSRFADQGPFFFTSMFVKAGGKVQFDFQHAWNGKWDQQTQGNGIEFCVHSYHQPANTADPQPMPGVLLPLVFLKREHHADGTIHSMRWANVRVGYKQLEQRVRTARWLHNVHGRRVAEYIPRGAVNGKDKRPRKTYTIVFMRRPDYLPKQVVLHARISLGRAVRLAYTFHYKRFATKGGPAYLPVLVHEKVSVTGGKRKPVTAEFVEHISHLQVNTPLPMKTFMINRHGIEAIYHGRKIFWVRPGSKFHPWNIPRRLYRGQ